MTTVSNSRPNFTELKTNLFAPRPDLMEIMRRLSGTKPDEPAADPASENESVSPTAEKVAAAKKPAFRINNIYLPKGEFVHAGSPTHKYLVHWEQAKPARGFKYPRGATPVKINVYLSGQKSSWTALPSYILNGVVHARLKTTRGRVVVFKSPGTVHTRSFKALVAITNQLRLEGIKIKRFGASSLRSAFRNKNGEITATYGTVLLAGLIAKVGVKNIAFKRNAFAARIFDNLQRLINHPYVGEIVQKMAVKAGFTVLKDSKVSGRGRRLMDPETSRAAEERANRAANIPAPPWRAAWEEMLWAVDPFGTEEEMMFALLERAVITAANRMGAPYYRQRYANELLSYLIQTGVINPPNPVVRSTFGLILENLLVAAHAAREGRMLPTQYRRAFNQNMEKLRPYAGGRFWELVMFFQRLAAFEPTRQRFTELIAAEFRRAVEARATAEGVGDQFRLPTHLVQHIFALALIGIASLGV